LLQDHVIAKNGWHLHVGAEDGERKPKPEDEENDFSVGTHMKKLLAL
jgi:hypothetical protein